MFNNNKIIKEIQNIANEGDSTLMEAVIHCAEQNDIEVETIGDLIRKLPSVKAQLQIEAENLNMIEKSSRLPL